MSSSKDASIYGFQRPKRLKGNKEISSSNSGSFANALGSLIDASKEPSSTREKSSKSKSKKEDIFATHNRNTAARAQRDLENAASSAFSQKHSTKGEKLGSAAWERSQRKMEEKARLYNAMRRGDVQDDGGKYDVDFDLKWADKHGNDESGAEDLTDDDEEEEDDGEMQEYVDEFGRTRQGTRAEVAREARRKKAQEDLDGDMFTARPSAPSQVIYGDAIQYKAFDPSAPIAEHMEQLASMRDRSPTPPEMHFDSTQEVRRKGMGFYQFSQDPEERRKQMEELERERKETERIRKERQDAAEQAQEATSPTDPTDREAADQRGYKRKADDFFDELDAKIAGDMPVESMNAMQKIEAALAREAE